MYSTVPPVLALAGRRAGFSIVCDYLISMARLPCVAPASGVVSLYRVSLNAAILDCVEKKDVGKTLVTFFLPKATGEAEEE
jgi:hypothetical protein